MPTASPTTKDLLAAMLRIRLTEQAIAARYPQQHMRCPVHLCVGQEAVPVGVCAALTPSDYAVSTHRGHGHYLAKGGSLPAMLAEIHGRVDGCCGGRGGSMHLLDPSVGFMGSSSIVGGSIPIGAGLAFGSMAERPDRVTAIFFGDAATEEGVFAETLNFAALKGLPALFVCENNQYSTTTPQWERRPQGLSLAGLAAAHGVPAAQADGNDVLAVREVAQAAVDRIRAGQGPRFLEFSTYRWLEHCGPNCDHAAGLRPLDDLRRWQARCPIDTLAARLLERGALDAAALDALGTALAAEIEAAFAFALQSPPPPPEDRLSRVYAPAGGAR